MRVLRNKHGGTAIAIACATAGTLMALAPTTGQTLQVQVTIENLAPVNGVYLTPLWVGFHDGSFDIYDVGAPAAEFLERLAEDGSTAEISAAFTGSVQGILSGPLGPGDSTSMVFDIDPELTSSRYFSYGSMVIPSNDAFIANGDPMEFRLFDDEGTFLGANFFVTGAQVLDAGTEINDEIPLHTAFFGQVTPDTGVDENGVVGFHPGFLPVELGGILADPMFANGDFTLAGYPIAQIRVSAVPLPGALIMLVSAFGGLGLLRRRDSTGSSRAPG
jgi:hypothetical protein